MLIRSVNVNVQGQACIVLQVMHCISNTSKSKNTAFDNNNNNNKKA